VFVVLLLGGMIFVATITVLVVLRNSYGIVLLPIALVVGLVLWLPAGWLVSKGWRLTKARQSGRSGDRDVPDS